MIQNNLDEQMLVAKKQYTCAVRQQDIRCGTCNRPFRIERLYRCYYCGIFYCEHCAGKHFGKTREQYNKEKFEPFMIQREEL